MIRQKAKQCRQSASEGQGCGRCKEVHPRRQRDRHHGRQIRLHTWRTARGRLCHRYKKDTYQGDTHHRQHHHQPLHRFPPSSYFSSGSCSSHLLHRAISMNWIEAGVEWLGGFFSQHCQAARQGHAHRRCDIGGVGSVIVFLPQILILYFFISYMEDSGYMARAAFIMDKLMHKMGLHGKSFIPLIMGSGCNVPAVMVTRTIESRRSRLITMMILPMMSCRHASPSIMIIGTMFGTAIPLKHHDVALHPWASSWL